MQMTDYIRSSEQIASVLSVARTHQLIRKGEHERLLRRIENNSYEVQDVPFFDMRFLDGCDRDLIFSFADRFGIKIDNFEGWWVYDERLWVYASGNSDNGKYLENPSKWFEARRLRVFKNKEGIIMKRILFVKYPPNIEEVLRKGKSIYFIKQVRRKTLKRSGGVAHFTLEEIEDFEGIIYIENKKTKTRLYYGVWS